MVNLGLLLQTTSLLTTIDCKYNAQFCDWPEMYLAGPTLEKMWVLLQAPCLS